MLIAFRVTVEENELLENEAAGLGISRSALIRQRIFTAKPQEIPQNPPSEPPPAKKPPQAHKPAPNATCAKPNTLTTQPKKWVCACGQANFSVTCSRCGEKWPELDILIGRPSTSTSKNPRNTASSTENQP